MYTDKDSNNKLSLCDLSVDEAGLIQTALIRLAEASADAGHARTLRRIAIAIDRTLNHCLTND